MHGGHVIDTSTGLLAGFLGCRCKALALAPDDVYLGGTCHAVHNPHLHCATYCWRVLLLLLLLLLRAHPE